MNKHRPAQCAVHNKPHTICAVCVFAAYDPICQQVSWPCQYTEFTAPEVALIHTLKELGAKEIYFCPMYRRFYDVNALHNACSKNWSSQHTSIDIDTVIAHLYGERQDDATMKDARAWM